MRVLIATAMLCLAATMVPAGAQTTKVEIDVTGPHNPYCGSWQNDTWVPNGNCVTMTPPATNTTTVVTQPPNGQPVTDNGRMWQTLHGTIVGVNGHMVTIQQSERTLLIDDSPALSRMDTGRVAVGRQVVLHGYWQGGVYYATAIN